jgi:hypothetical protein
MHGILKSGPSLAGHPVDPSYSFFITQKSARPLLQRSFMFLALAGQANWPKAKPTVVRALLKCLG